MSRPPTPATARRRPTRTGATGTPRGADRGRTAPRAPAAACRRRAASRAGRSVTDDEPGDGAARAGDDPTTTRPPTTPTTQGSVGGAGDRDTDHGRRHGGRGRRYLDDRPRRLDEHHERTWLVGPRGRRRRRRWRERPAAASSASATEPVADDGGSPVGVVVGVLVALALGGAAAITADAPALAARSRRDGGAPPPGAAPGRVVALGARHGHRRQPHHQPVPARCSSSRWSPSSCRPAAPTRRGREGFKAYVYLGLVVIGDPGRVPHAARRGSTAPTSSSRCPRCRCPTRSRASASAVPVSLEGVLAALYDGLRLADAAPLRRGRQRARQPEAAAPVDARGAARDRGGRDGRAQRRPAAHRERPARAARPAGCAASPAAGSTSSARSPCR